MKVFKICLSGLVLFLLVQTMGFSQDPSPVPGAETESILGDVNGDSTVDILDALMVAHYIVGPTFTFDPAAADVNTDDTVNIIDALLIAQYYVGLTPELPPPLAGGYSLTPLTSDTVVAAYDFLAAKLAAEYPDIVISVVNFAFSQVVAGTNIKLVCTYSTSGNPNNQYLSAVIYFDLDMVLQDVTSLYLGIYSM